MIRYLNRVKLHQHDIDWLFKLTSVHPGNIQTVEELNRYVDSHLNQFDERTPEGQLLKLLLADVRVGDKVAD